MKTLKHLAITLLLASTSIVFAQTGSSDQALYSKIDNYLTAGSQNGFSGALSVVQNGNLIINKGYGLANKDKKAFNNPNTIFDIGSNTKQFTSTAILKLAETEALQLSDSLDKYFEDLPSDKRNITIHQLMTHSAGLPDAIGRDFDLIPTDEFFKKLFSRNLLSSPGERYAYSNTGYSVLARIIELVSGHPYETYIKEQLLIPAGMRQTGYLLPDWNREQLARGYNRNVLDSDPPVQQYQASGEISWNLKGNGGINSTQNDLLLWMKALTNEHVISSSSFDLLKTSHILSPKGTYGYGYGWVVRRTKTDVLRLSHNGSNGTFSHSIIWYPEEDTFIIYATNANSGQVESLAYVIEKMMVDVNYKPEPIIDNVYSFTMKYMDQHPSENSSELTTLLRESYPEDMSNSRLLNTMGNLLLKQDEKLDWALELFKINVGLYPEDGNLWDSLGDGYKVNDLKVEAMDSYKKAIDLGYKDAASKLAEMSQD